jgi:hypothetical protein
MKKQLVLSIVLLPILLFILSSDSFASEGEIHLANQDGTSAECKALSVLMPSLDYDILMTCRNLTYPGNVNQFNYIAWAEPSDGGGAERLGELGVGKVSFDIDQPFNRIFVTKEGSSRPRRPSESIVMSGNVQPIGEFSDAQPETSDKSPEQSPTPTPSTAENRSFISRLFQPGRIIVFLGVILLLILVFILTRR